MGATAGDGGAGRRGTERLAPDATGLARAAALVRGGALVAFPTETVYGLGALALDPLAVRGIYAAKGRPSSNPLIVHVPGVAGARALVAAWPPEAERLAARFWPGPLTLVLPRAECVPDEVTAGGPTVAVRAPGHPVAQALLAAVGAPVAAPSANRSEHVSPTRAEHVVADLDGRIDAVVDGGPCAVGIESTVLWIAGGKPRVLRPGAVGREEIEEVIGDIEAPSSNPSSNSSSSSSSNPTPDPLPSPGLHTRHYAPAAHMVLSPCPRLRDALAALPRPRGAIVRAPGPIGADEVILLPPDPAGFARELYGALRALEERGCVSIGVEDVPREPAWEAVLDRLRRATG